VVPLDAFRRAVASAEQVLELGVRERQPLEVHPPAVRPPMARVAAVRVAELLRPEPEIAHSLSHREGVHLRDGLLVGHHDVLAVHQLHVRFHHFVEHASERILLVGSHKTMR